MRNPQAKERLGSDLHRIVTACLIKWGQKRNPSEKGLQFFEL